MVGWYHRFNGHEFEQSPGDVERQGNLVCCSPWDHKELDMPEQLKITDIRPLHLYLMYGTVLNSLL